MAKTKKEPRSDWHTMFYGALELILDSNIFSCQFQRELTKEPLQIDAVIVKKLRDAEPAEKIAKLFLRDNIVEFKSPEDHLSIADFYKVHAYAYLYRVVEKDVSVKDMTLTFVERRHPRGLLEHLEKDLGYRVEWKWPGICYAYGGQFPTQFIETKLLEDAENIWLRHLGRRLGVSDLAAVLSVEYDAEKREARTRYIEPLVEANLEALEEASKMARGMLDDFVRKWVEERPDIKERLLHESGFISPEVFEAERLKAEVEKAEWLKAEAEKAERLKAEAEAERLKAETEKAERLKAEAETEWLKAEVERLKAMVSGEG